MLIVSIRLVSARTHEETELGRIHIANQGTGTQKRGNYTAQIMRRGTADKVQTTVEIYDYPRLSYSVWELVRRVLNGSKKQVETSQGAEDLLAEQKLEALNRQELQALQEDLKALYVRLSIPCRDDAQCDHEHCTCAFGICTHDTNRAGLKALQRTEALLMKLLGVFL